jgi:hypothetical protein
MNPSIRSTISRRFTFATFAFIAIDLFAFSQHTRNGGPHYLTVFRRGVFLASRTRMNRAQRRLGKQFSPYLAPLQLSIEMP